MVFGKHTPFQVLVWQMRPQVRRILFTLVYDIRANRLLTTSRLFTPLWAIWLVYTTVVNMIGLHHCGQYDWFTPWWSIWLVYTVMVNMIGLHHDGQYDWFTPWWSIWLIYTWWSIWLIYTMMVNMIGLHVMVNMIGLHHDGQYDWFTPWWSIWLVYTMMVNMIGLHRDGQYDWFTPWWSIWLVYTMMVNMIGLHHYGQYDWFTPWVTTMLFVLLYEKTTSRITILCFHVWTLNFEARAYIPVKLNKEATYSVLSPLSPRKLKRVTPVKRLLFKNLHWESVFGSINKYISLFTCMQCLVNGTG